MLTPPRYRAYIICTTPRSGSTLLCRLLAATGRAGRPESYFHTPNMDGWLNDYDLNREAFSSDQEAAAAVFAAAKEQGEAGTGIFGLRVQRKSFAFFIGQTATQFPNVETDADRVRAVFGQVLYIYLTRRDKLRQAVSLVKAEQTGLWHKTADGAESERLSPPGPPVYDAQRIREKCDELTALDAEWPVWFAQQGVEPHCLSYEDLSADPQGGLAQVLGALGLDPSLAAAVETPTAKLSDEISNEWINQFRAEYA